MKHESSIASGFFRNLIPTPWLKRFEVGLEPLSRSLLVLCLCVASGVLMASAQATGTVQGTVRDSTGAVVANATVVLLNPSTDHKVQTTTNQSGAYSFIFVAPGQYRINIDAPGFAGSWPKKSLWTWPE
jgi:hypothetical protein